MNVEQVLRQLIQKLIDESPTQKLKTVYVLVTENDQLKERLDQAKNHYSGERLVLIPYNLENSHTTGIFIKFNENNQIERAEFINPVSEFPNIPDQLEQYFHEIFPNDYLHVKSCEHVDDQKLSAFLTSKYLLELVKEWGFTKHQSSSMINERISPNIDKSLFSEGNRFNFNDSVLDVESSLYTQTLSIPVKISATEESFDTINCMNRQMSQSYEELKKQLQETFDDLDIVNEDDLEKRIVEKKQRIDDLTSRGNQDGAKKRKRSLTKLEEIQLLLNRVKELENSNISNDGHMLKIEIESAFSERDIQNEEHLKRLIIEKKQRIETLKKDGKLDNARKREKSLSELEHIQSLVDRWNTMTLSSTETTSEMQQTLEDNFSIDDNIDDSSDQQEISIKIETLRNMHKDFQSIPSCSERFVISLLYHISLQLSNCSTTQNFDHFQSDQLEIEVNKEFENLKERIKIEECLSMENQNSVQELSIHIKNKNWENCLSLLRKIFKEISPLNIHDLFRLIDKVDDAAELIKNKDIIFFLGGTGSGKSTTIHFLTGSKMIATKVGGLNHIAPTNLRNSDLQYVTTSPFARSETRCITPVNVNYKDVGMIRAGNIILCDTPGFEDTNGPEVDIANGISIVRAIRQCHSVKPVVLVSYKSLGDRFEGLKSLTHLLAGLIPGIQDEIRAFSYIFTKYPENERNTIYASLINISETMSDQEKSDTSFMNLFQDMLQKTKRHTLVLDPIRDEPSDFLNELVNSASIQEPENVFQFSITDKSKTVVHDQIRKYQLSIMSAVNHSEYLLIKYQLDQMKRLNNLLEQDYIEQIYSDCIRHLSKHLVEEYQQAIALLNRCLIHQTVLTDSDIEQYQTYIDHAASAEILRKDHLESESVHSSAFIQYLNQQLDEIKGDLSTKEIDDLSVKTNLDKIKLLTKYFPQINDMYKNLCQLFMEKIHLKVNLFDSLVLNNQFEECATIMENLADASNIFQHHFDDEFIKMKHTKLIESFMNYLRNSVQDLDYLFKHTKLDKNDIDRISSCLIKIKTALDTTSLTTFICKQDIKQIHDNFLEKISKFFKNLIQEIKNAFRKPIAFENLENLIEQSDLVRTIPSVALETSQMYYETLEELFGCVFQLRRDAEELLRLLFLGEETVDFEKLAKCLSNLKNLSWIDKHRNGLYSEVINNVEQLILQHVEKLKKCILQTNLDLEHYHEIKDVSKKLAGLNDIKQLENFIPTINEHIKEANVWFQSMTNRIYDIIRMIFNSEKLNEQECKNFDFFKAERAFHYLNACKDVYNLVKTDCFSVLDSLENFVKDFSISLQNEMEKCFDIIKKSLDTNEILDKVRLFASRIQEISDIEKSCPYVFALFVKQTIVQDWHTELANYCLELSTEMASLSLRQRTEALNTKLTTAKALSKLDKFLDTSKFIDIYNKYQKVFFSQNNDIGQQVIDAIKNFDYEGIAVKMMILQSSNEVGKHFYAEAKRPLNTGLEQLIETTESQAIMLGNTVALEDIKLIVNNLKRMERAKQFISKHLDAPEKIDESIKKVKKILEERIQRYIIGVRALIDNHNFYEADRKIESITLVRNFLGIYCTKETSDDIENLTEYQYNVVLTNVVNKYSEMDISSYTLNPPTDIFEKFGQVNQTNPVYNRVLNQIKEKILAKFREELDKAKSRQPPDSENIHIRRFESAVKYLPDAMRNALEVELKHCKDDILQLIQDNETKLNNAFSSGDVRNIKIILQEYEKSQELQSFANRVKTLVLKEIHEIVQKINDNFERYEIREAFTHVKKLYNYKIELEELINDINRPYSEIRLRIIKIFDDAYLSFTNRFLSSHILISEDENIAAAVERSFICLTEFMKFNDDHNNQAITTHVLPDSFNDRIAALIKKIQDYSNEHREKCRNALEKVDADSLLNIFKIMSTWNSLLTKVKVYYDVYNSQDRSVRKIIESLQELTHHAQMLQTISRKIEDLRDELLNQELIIYETREFSNTRDEFYRRLNEKLVALNRAKALGQLNMQIDIDKIERQCLGSLETKIRAIGSNCEKFTNKISENSTLTRGEYDQINLFYSNLLSIKQEVKMMHLDMQLIIDKIEEIIFDKIRSWEASIENDATLLNVFLNLKNIKHIANNLSSLRVKVNERIDEILKIFKNKHDVKTFAKLGTILNQDKDGLGQSIISEHKLFQGFSLSLFNEKTKRHDIVYVLNALKGTSIHSDKLRRRYNTFHNMYEKLVQENLRPDMKLDQLISDTKLITGTIRQNSDTIKWDSHVKNQVPTLAAHIFALWTLSKADHYFEAEGLDDRKNYLIQPHAAQVVSIFRLLGIGYQEETLTNNLVQIGTGEGKSIVLAVTAIILALIGFDVNCACFSEYLSQRDYLAFLPLFELLETHQHIHYGTFNKLCEDMINETGDIRQLVEKLISNSSDENKNLNAKSRRQKILLIDEVDVFFSRDFYGNVYTPSASLKDPTITSLVHSIWTQRKLSLNLRRIQMTPEYKACSEQFPKWILLIDEAIKDMLADVQSFESHDYVVKNNKIGYIEQDNIVYNVVYGYKTLFAYHHEHEKGNISRESLLDNIAIRINCGSFSYAEIPLQFRYIMGVTGTLETLSEPEKKVITEDYKISKETIVPSVFGQNNLRFIEKDDIKIENSDDYFNRIKREIDDRIVGRNSEKRAILVFFESKVKLMQFYESPALESMKESVVCLTEDALLQEKETIISRATVSGQVTLFTRTFGRGTDFICHDQNVATNGGTHVIQTFLSEEFSEEKQIKGRTARQGDQGSYSLILLENDLEKFHIDKTHIEEILKGKGLASRVTDTITDALRITKTYNTLYDFLHDRRTDLFKTQYEENMKYVEQAKEKHVNSQKFLTHLRTENVNSVQKFLIEENRGAGGTSRSRTVCLMDATGSMTYLLHKCKNTVDIMFERTSEILKDHGMNPDSFDSFQLQFVVYRNYNSSHDKLLQSSPWETKPHHLRAFMSTIEIDGGWGNEAIEIGFWHANKEHEREPITQVILIGDAPPNSLGDVRAKRNCRGEHYWRNTRFAQSTYYERELDRLVENNIPVHAFYVEERAREKFQEISKRTHGRCEMLDINSSLGSDMLTNLVTEEILNNIGGQSKGKELVSAYRKKFAKSYTSNTESISKKKK